MNKPSIPLSFLILSALLCLGTSAWAQQDAAPPTDIIVVRPTDNGLDELMEAGSATIDDAATPRGKVIADGESGAATLAQRRAAVREPSFRNALAEMRGALGKPMILRLEKPEDAYQFGSPMRRLARLLAIEQYVLLSDGKVPAAIDSLADSLALADATQRFGLIGVMSGEAIVSAAIQPFARHLDQLSSRDCDHLFSLLKSELNAPNPAAAGIQAESKVAQSYFVMAIDEDVKGWNEAGGTENVAGGDPDEPTGSEKSAILQMRKYNPAAWSAFETAVGRDFAEFSDAAVRRLNEYPAAPADPATVFAAGSESNLERLADKWARSVSGFNIQDRIVERAVISRTRLQVLAVHAAILRWRWEHNELPNDLATLKLGALANDPFTGGTLLYKRLDGIHYALSAAGAVQRDDNGSVVPRGERVPVTVSYPRPAP